MALLDELVARVGKTTHGFTDIRQAADEIMAQETRATGTQLAYDLFRSEVAQARMLAAFLLGALAAEEADHLQFLRERVSHDGDWRVQEILAQAFDQFCKDTGYEAALPTIDAWLNDAHPHVRRAVTEGLRIWTSRPYFKAHPLEAIRRLSMLRADESDYVSQSVGNALRDISRKHADLIRAELSGWDLGDKHTCQTYQLAAKFLGDQS